MAFRSFFALFIRATTAASPIHGKSGCYWILAIAFLTMSQPTIADPCGAVMCLAQNKSAPQECKGHVDEYFNIRVYRKRYIFDPGATAGKRYNEVLNNCSDARQEDKDYVSAKYGTLEHYPFDYASE